MSTSPRRCNKEASQPRDYCVAKLRRFVRLARFLAAQKRLLGMTSELRPNCR
jgi:hypothetical protein